MVESLGSDEAPLSGGFMGYLIFLAGNEYLVCHLAALIGAGCICRKFFGGGNAPV